MTNVTDIVSLSKPGESRKFSRLSLPDCANVESLHRLAQRSDLVEG